MYFFTAASVLAAHQQVPFYEMQDRMGYRDENIYFEHHPEQRAWSVPQRLEYQKREATSIVAHNPLTSARIQLSGVIRLMFDPGGVEFLKLFGVYPKEGGGLLGRLVDKGIFRTVTALMVERPLVFWSSALLLPLELFLILCAFVGVFYRRPVQEDFILVVVLVVIYYVTVSGGPAAVGRYRVPVMPIICMLAGYGAWSIWSGALKSRVVCRSA